MDKKHPPDAGKVQDCHACVYGNRGIRRKKTADQSKLQKSLVHHNKD
jgi:hypothetical protein